MKYPVPLFIEREARIIPGLTFKQFIVLLVFFALAGACFKVFPSILKWVFGFLFSFLGVFLAFFKIEGWSPFQILGAAFQYFTQARIYIWKKEKEFISLFEEEKKQKIKKEKPQEEKKEEVFLPSKKSQILATKLKIEMKTK